MVRQTGSSSLANNVRLHLAKAQGFLNEAAGARQHGLDQSLAHNIYYAALHAADAFLRHLGYEYKKHRETLEGFRRHVVKPGILTREHNVTIARAQTIRDETDYNVTSIPDPKKLRETHDRVIQFVGDIIVAIGTTPARPKAPEQKHLMD